MTDIKRLECLRAFLAAQRNVATYMLWAMEDLEKGKDQHSYANLFLWCQARDDRAEVWRRLKNEYQTATMLKEGFYP